MINVDMLLAVMIAGFGLNFSLMLIIWNSLNNKIDGVQNQLNKVIEDVKDIDRRLCRIEGAMAAKECCVLKDDRNLRKVE